MKEGSLVGDLWLQKVQEQAAHRARLRGLSVPALVILAEASKAHNIRRVAAAARASVPEVRVEVLAEASHHSIPAAQAGAVSRLLLDFLRPQVPDQCTWLARTSGAG